MRGLAQVSVTWKWVALPTLYLKELSWENPFPPWASAHPEAGTLQPATMQQITISVSAQQAKRFAHKQASELLNKVKVLN